MRVVITGGAGFLGQLLAAHLIGRSDHGLGPIDELVLVDLVEPPPVRADAVVSSAVGDLADAEFVRSVVNGEDVSIFHLASMVSAECERDFDGAYRVNVGATHNLLEASRACARPRFTFASSIVAFGGCAPDEVVSDETKRTPETTYGTTKAICELMISDYTRKGFIDGRVARLPTVVIRPGAPNAAASGWVSGMSREPLRGVPSTVPVAPDLSLPVAGYRTTVQNIVRLHAIDESLLGGDRGYCLPSIDVTPASMLDALERVAAVPRQLVTYEPDPAIESFFDSWAHHAAFDRARSIGLVGDADFDSILREYLDDFATPNA